MKTETQEFGFILEGVSGKEKKTENVWLKQEKLKKFSEINGNDNYAVFAEQNTLQLLEDIKWADAIVLGPGIGRSDTAVQMVTFILQHAEVPLVLDADALNILAEDMSKMQLLHTNCIVTPHLGEFSRLTKKSISEIQKQMIKSAVDFSKAYGVICVLKDFRTVIAGANPLHFLNLSGNNGMATGGSGDVLAGVIGALLAQGLTDMEATTYGVFIHGLAGDRAKEKMGTHAIMASDLIESLKEVWKGIEDAQY